MPNKTRRAPDEAICYFFDCGSIDEGKPVFPVSQWIYKSVAEINGDGRHWEPLAISIDCPPKYLSLEEYDITHVNSIRTAIDITKLILNSIAP